jgi:hypothetical protein
MAVFVPGVGLQFKYVVFPEAVLLSLGYLMASYRRDRDLGSASVAAGFMMLAGLLTTVLWSGIFGQKGRCKPFSARTSGLTLPMSRWCHPCVTSFTTARAACWRLLRLS